MEIDTKQSLSEVNDLIKEIKASKSYTTIPVSNLLTEPMTPASTSTFDPFLSNVNPPAPRVFKKYSKKNSDQQPQSVALSANLELTITLDEMQIRKSFGGGKFKDIIKMTD